MKRCFPLACLGLVSLSDLPKSISSPMAKFSVAYIEVLDDVLVTAPNVMCMVISGNEGNKYFHITGKKIRRDFSSFERSLGH